MVNPTAVARCYRGLASSLPYLLLDLRRKGISVRELVSVLEQAVIALLARYGIQALARTDAPVSMFPERKDYSLGLRVRRGCSFHGVALNVNLVGAFTHQSLWLCRIADDPEFRSWVAPTR